MRVSVVRIRVFIITMVVTTIGCTFLWERVASAHYDCTDDGFPGYWMPGCWVHAWPEHSVLTVPRVTHGRAMSEPDVVDEQWGMRGLWVFWMSLFTGSLALSSLTARLLGGAYGRPNTGTRGNSSHATSRDG